MPFIDNKRYNNMPNLFQKIHSKFRYYQNKVDSSIKTKVYDESVLQPGRFWVKSITWSLIGTTGFFVAWLSLAKTDEVGIANGKLEPIGDVKSVQIPVGGVALSILVKSGDYVEKGDILIQLDTETARQNVNSYSESLKQKKFQLAQKSQQYLLKNDEKENTIDITNQKVSSIASIYELEN